MNALPPTRDLAAWLFDLAHRATEEIHLGLDRITAVAKKLGPLKGKQPLILVGGTNGKGSTVRALESLYLAAGYQVAAYTSPHLRFFNERIRFNATPISDAALCSAFELIDAARADIFLSYFEMTTLAALCYFKSKPVDLMILEVGMGGRLDATNCLDPDLAIISSIDFDHEAYLGSTLNAIAKEKAGILRSRIPFIYADSNPPPALCTAAVENEVSFYCYGRDFTASEQAGALHFEANFLDAAKIYPLPQIHLKAAASALSASFLLQDRLPVSEAARSKALAGLFLPGRLQQLKYRNRRILLDVSHNPQSVALLAAHIQALKPQAKVHAVFSALRDKKPARLIEPLKALVDYWYPAALTHDRALSAAEMLAVFKEAEVCTSLCYNDPISAFEQALLQAEPQDLIVVYGSFITLGQLLSDPDLSCTFDELTHTKEMR